MRFEDFKAQYDDDTPISEIKREYKIYYGQKNHSKPSMEQAKKVQEQKLAKLKKGFTTNELKKIKQGYPFKINFEGKDYEFTKMQGGELVVFTNNEKGITRLVTEIGEHNLLEITDSQYLNVRPDLNQKPRIKSLKPITKVRPHKRTGTRGVRGHTRRNKK